MSRAEQPRSLEESLLDSLPARSIGPANMSGRITAIAVVPNKTSTMYVGAASGGVWKTVNNGATWKPIFDQQPVASIGDIALAPSNPKIVWVGTGEANLRNSVSWGDGVYKSTDGGKTWADMGLKDTRHIGRIVIHPSNPEIVYVAAVGHAWGPNKERGIFKTLDGGHTWEAVLSLDEDTGCIDLSMDPKESDTLYACAYQVRRDQFAAGSPATQFGAKAGLYKTTDGGKNWERLTKGLPENKVGRCALAIFPKDPRIIYATLPTEKTGFARETEFGQPAKTKQDVETGGIFRSEDSGATWKKVNDLCPRPFYFGQIRVDTADDQRVYVLGVTLHFSTDGGLSFKSGGDRATHDDIHALWIDPNDTDHMVLGTDGGLYLTYDRGGDWEAFKNLPIGQFYGIAVDSRRPYHIYGGLQDNGTWGGPSATHSVEGITVADWVKILGSDGFRCQVDPSDPDTVYAESQCGMLRRINLRTAVSTFIRPQPPKGDAAYRFNWDTPVLVSPHDPRMIYFGGNHVFRSSDRGDHWEVISKDLTKGEPGPDKSAGHTITVLAESPITAGLLFASADDGRICMTRNAGKEWIDISNNIPGVPQDRWITSMECSRFTDGVVYLTLDRHRQDDCRPYVYKSLDYGATWQLAVGNLPISGPVHVIREDPRNRQLLYVGTEFGAFVSLDAGGRWNRLNMNLPPAPVHDLIVHPRERELIVGTHGRSLYVVDVAPVQDWSSGTSQIGLFFFDVKPAMVFEPQGSHLLAGTKTFAAPNPSYGATLRYFLKEKSKLPVRLTVADARGNKVASLEASVEPGFHQITWDLKPSKEAKFGPDRTSVPPGDYTVKLEAGSQSVTKKLHIELEE